DQSGVVGFLKERVHLHISGFGSGDYIGQDSKISQLGCADVANGGFAVKLRMHFGVAAAVDFVVALHTVIGQGFAMHLPPGQPGSVGEDGGHHHVDSTFLLQSIEALVHAFIHERPAANLYGHELLLSLAGDAEELAGFHRRAPSRALRRYLPKQSCTGSHGERLDSQALQKIPAARVRWPCAIRFACTRSALHKRLHGSSLSWPDWRFRIRSRLEPPWNIR